jgi:hypothetical protein
MTQVVLSPYNQFILSTQAYVPSLNDSLLRTKELV